MTGPEVVLVAAAGGLGALVRHELTSGHHTVRWTAGVNVVGAGLLGLATVGALSSGPLLVVGGGLLGGMTTFSTWMVQAETDAATGRVVLLPLLAGVVAAAAGRLLGLATGLGP